MLRFVLYSLNVSGNAGSAASFTTYNQLNFGDPYHLGWETASYSDVRTGSEFAVSDPELLTLTPFSFPNIPIPVPEPSSLPLMLLGIAAIAFWSKVGFLM